MQFRLLDLFCGAGGCTKGYQEAGFWVRGLDIEPQPKYVGNDFVQGDALAYLQGLIDSGEIASFDAVHASPPCQAHSALRNMWNSRPHADLIPQTRELLQASGLPFVMENVPGAPLENAPLFGVWRVMLCGTMFGLQTKCGAQLQRHRFFELNWESEVAPICQHSEADMIGVTGSGQPVGSKKRRTITITGSTPQQNVVRNQVRQTYPIDAARVAMGIDWMPMKSLSQAIPPAYTAYLGRQLAQVVAKSASLRLAPLRGSQDGAAGGLDTQEALARSGSGGSLNRSHADAIRGGGSFAALSGRALSAD